MSNPPSRKLAGIALFDYLTQLRRHHERVATSPADWMPWNYQRQLASV